MEASQTTRTPELLPYDEQIVNVLADLNAERADFWLDLHARVERTKGRDSQLNAQYKESNRRMDGLLDRYGGLLLLSGEMADVKVLA